jgi:arsenate reductase
MPLSQQRRPRLPAPREKRMRQQMPDRPYNVLFLCTGNSARSILAEAILNRIGKGKFVAYSAGSQPKGEVNPDALVLLERLGYTTRELRSKSWDEFSRAGALELDFVFTVCDNAANEVCPIWPGQPMTAHWGVPDPAVAVGDSKAVEFAFRDAFLLLQRRIELFASLPVKSLDRMSLKKRLDEIGQASVAKESL